MQFIELKKKYLLSILNTFKKYLYLYSNTFIMTYLNTYFKYK